MPSNVKSCEPRRAVLALALALALPWWAPRASLAAEAAAGEAVPLAITDPIALSLRYDSRDAAHKQPFGAVPAATLVNFNLHAAPGVSRVTLVIERRQLEGDQRRLAYEPVARVPMLRGHHGVLQRWSASHRFEAVAVHGYWFEVEIGGRSFVLQNNADAVHWTREKGSGGVGAVAERPTQAQAIRRFRLSVFDPKFEAPAWARDAVYYYIFPDRYRNGDASNDPKPGTRRYQSHDIEFHANWLDKPWKPKTGDGSDAVYNNDFFGGDIAGIIEKLDDIADLGANALYFTPIFRAASNHRYDTADYRQVDPALGTNADFARLTAEAAKRGIRVIPDASLNHTGSDSIYFDRFGNFKSGGAFEGGRIRADSPYASWYRFDPTQTDPDKQYPGWAGVPDLPELDKAAPAWRDFAYRANDSVTRLWLQRGAAGWRMDVAPWVPDDFWRGWRQAVKQTRPDAIAIAETWFDASKHLLGDMFDSTMNYIFRNAVLDYAGGGKAGALVANLEHLREAYPPQAHGALMNLLSSHDVARSLHVFGHLGEKALPEQIALATQRLKLAVFFQMTYPGAPAVYYGDEVGVTGGDDPFNRGTYPWADRGGQPDLALRAEFKRLIALRKAHPVLRHGSLQAPLHVDDQVVVLARRSGDAWAITATNNGGQARTVTVTLPEGAPPAFANALTAEAVRAEAGHVTLSVPALFGTVLVGR